MFKKFFRFFLLFTIYYLLFTKFCFASDEFETSYQIEYTLLSDGLCQVKQQVSLTNKLTNIYATEYKMTIGSTRVKSINASDEGGKIEPQVKIEENTTVITLQFNQKIVGKGKTLTFNLGYTTPDFAILNGKVLEIGIPKLVEVEKLKDYKVRLIIPSSYGKPAYFIPYPQKRYPEGNYHVFEFTKDQLVDQGISAAFGESQVLDFQLHYYLRNNSLMPAKFQVTLPPDTAYQTVYYDYLDPLPLNVDVDKDGNWLAIYELESKKAINITASGSATIFMQPKSEFKQEFGNKEEYLKSQKYWNTEDEKIVQLAKKLQTPKNIYQFVVNNLIYDYGRIEGQVKRFGAVNALENKESAICMEFTDLFISLSRAAGIPAREINGYAYTNNPILRPLSLRQDVLHAWPEYYDFRKNLWIPVDPTWGNTTGGVDFFNKLDFNHFAFVIHGLSSEYPLSAGSYKEEGNQQKKDIYIQFGDKIEKKDKINLEIDFPKKLLAGLPIQGTVTIKNVGNNAIYNMEYSANITTNSTQSFESKESKEVIKILPPFSFLSKKINFGKTKWYKKESINLVFSFADQKKIHQVQICPFWQLEILEFIIKLTAGLLYFFLISFVIRYFSRRYFSLP